MDAKVLLEKTLQNSHFQISKCFEGLKPELWDKKTVDGALTPRETVDHLADCCIALQRASRGETHEWHSSSSPDQSEAGLLAYFAAERAKAVEIALASDNPDLMDKAMDYLALHEAYHVGQMVQFRLNFEPEWNSYSIYEGHA